jgi:protein-serine/threonine kinase
MSDFAKNLFGFVKQKSSTPESLNSTQPTQQNLNGEPVVRVVSATGFPSEILPHATPTIGINEKSYAMGTTIKDPNALNRSINQFDHTQQSNLTAQLNSPHQEQISNNENLNHNDFNNNIQQNDQYNAKPQLYQQYSSLNKNHGYSLADATDVSENVQRGKLRISIMEASGLNVPSSYSQPYVVCTFESSEIVTKGPESYDPKNQHFSNNNNAHNNRLTRGTSTSQYNPSNPVWHHTAVFDVIGSKSQLQVSVYDTAIDGTFLGHVTISPKTIDDSRVDQWYDLQPRLPNEPISGKIRIKLEYSNINKRHYGPNDFEILRLLGKGTFGQVFQVKKKDSQRIYAMKVLSKQVIVKKKEIAHTIGERNILVRTANTESPFIVSLKFSFQTPTDLYLVTDFMSGGELFWHLQKEGRFSEERAKFYIAELVLALEHLHDNDIVYRDLKPENILLDANGHIALCDFGLSKANLTGNGTTNTFCGTTEYLAPEVLLDESGYTKMVDFWSLGVLIFEICCGWSPFYAENTQQMYKNIAFGKVRFPKEVLSMEGRSFVKGLLNRNPKHRLGAINDARELRAHPFFHDIDWENLKNKKLPPPFVPHIANELDTSNFDPEFTNASTSAINRQLMLGSTPLSLAVQENFKGFTYVDESTMFDHFNPSMGRRGSYKPQYGSFIPGNPNLPPEEEVIDEQSEIEEEVEEDDMDVDDEFVNGQFDL